jgi:competence protein ComGC
MQTKKFSIVEILVVLGVILILMLISVYSYFTIKKSSMVKSQQMEFEVIKFGIESLEEPISRKPHYQHVSIYDLVYTRHIIKENRILLVNGSDQAKSNAQILSIFGTPIEVYVTKQKIDATVAQIENGYANIPGHKYLTGNFAFYYGNDHEQDGGEYSGATSTPFGLKGNGTINEAHKYYYKLVYKEPDNGKAHEYYLQ